MYSFSEFSNFVEDCYLPEQKNNIKLNRWDSEIKNLLVLFNQENRDKLFSKLQIICWFNCITIEEFNILVLQIISLKKTRLANMCFDEHIEYLNLII